MSIYLFDYYDEDYQYSVIDTPLYKAVHCGDLNLVPPLLDQISRREETSESRSLMHTAAARGHAEIVSLFCQRNFPVNDRDHKGNTPLHLAIIKNHPSVFDILVTRCDINTKNSNGETPLHLAIQREHIQLAETLIKLGANVNVQHDLRETPLYYAMKNCNVKIVESLLKNGANVNVKNWASASCTHTEMAGSVHQY